MRALPEEFIAYHSRGARIEGAISALVIGWFQLWPLADIYNFNEKYQVAEYAPELFGFGSDGGGEMLAFNATDMVVMVPFIGMELNEFHHLISEGHGPSTSAFLSAFFGLVGLHGLHVTAGLCWMAVLMFEAAKTGLNPRVMTRLNCLSLFWHFLDIVWICVFTVVYLKGAM